MLLFFVSPKISHLNRKRANKPRGVQERNDRCLRFVINEKQRKSRDEILLHEPKEWKQK